MGLFKTIKTLDSKFSWSFMGFLIGILGIGYAIYIDQFKEEKPEIVFDVLSNTQVLSLKEDLTKLDIIYNGQNIKERKENLILLTIRISNEGTEDIRESDFYSLTQFGLSIKNGRIAEKPILIDATNEFLKKYLRVTHDSLNQILINKIPFDQNQSFTIKVLTICKESTLPTIEPIGKITGITGDFTVRESFKGFQKEEKSFIQNLTSGSFGIHVARFFFYLLCMIAFGLFVSLPLSQVSSFFDERKKKKKIQKFRDKTKIELSEKIEFIFDLYKNEGERYLKWLYSLISNEEKLKDYMLYFKNRRMEKLLMEDSFNLRRTQDEMYLEQSGHLRQSFEILNRLLKNNFIIEENDTFTVDSQFKKEMQEFIYFIEVQ